MDPLTGDFVKRHAEAISLYEKVIVLFLVKDPSLPRNTAETDIRHSADGNLTEYIIYYSAGGLLERGLSLLRYLSLGSRIIQHIRKEYGPPGFVHVNIIWKAGILALWLKRRFGWKYVITENWAGYTEQNPWGLHTKSVLVKKIYEKVYGGTNLFLPVSQDLARQVERWFPGTPAEVIYNVADTRLFCYRPVKGIPVVKKLVHVSTMNFQKNIEAILRVLARLTTYRQDVEVTLVGPYTAAVRQALADMGLLDKRVVLTGILPYAEVASLLRQSHILFLFSRYENQPCVILEALCCGLPVIATSVGGIPEIIDDSNGILVESEKEDQLLQAFDTMLDRYSQYDREKIALDAHRKFSYEAIGRQFAEMYREQGALK